MIEEAHLRNIKESIEEIEEAIEKGIENRQRTIGFHSSVASADFLELYLHREGLLPTSHILKHEWFASKNKIKIRIPFEFEKKEDILSLMRDIEQKRNILCYGKQQKVEVIENILDLFNKLREIFEELGINEEE